MTTVAIIGAGPLGRWLALEAARAGFRVLLEDVMPSNLALAARAAGEEALTGVEFVATIEDAVRAADLAIDCVPDELESKLEILWLLDRMAPPKTVLATPTTRLEIGDLAGCTYRADQCVGIALDPRDFTRVPAAGRIELKTTAKTSAEALERVREFWQRLGFGVECSLSAAMQQPLVELDVLRDD